MASLDQTIDSIIRPIADVVSAFIFYSVPIMGTQLPLIVLWLIIGGVFFTFYLGFINIRGFKHAIKLVKGDYADPKNPGDITQFQALTTAVSGTVGIGNIAGVAVAISVGGPGAVFWLILAGFLGMSTKFAECTLGVLYRQTNKDNSISGGPMYYLEHGLADIKWPKIGKALGMFYAGAIVIGCLGIGNMFQSNQAASILIDVTGGSESIFASHAWVIGLLLAIATGLVIVGGIKSIATTTSRLVPFMALLYIIMALLVLILNANKIPASFAAIWDGAFSPTGVSGGMVGVMIIAFRRAVFSNEAGLGSAAIAHSTAKTDRPVSEGYVALLEPFIDTVVICTITALVIITTVYDPTLATREMGGIEMTTEAFASTLSWSPVPLSIVAVLFAFSTMISWAYYGSKAFEYLVGENKLANLIFKLVFLGFVVIGSSIQLSSVVDLSDALVFVVAIPNMIGLYLLAPVIRRELNAYDRDH